MAIKIQNSTIIDDSRNIVNAGITTVTSVSIGNTQVISSARQLQNIASLDAVTTATIESAIANAPNTFTDLNVTGIATLSSVNSGNINSSGIITASSFSGSGANLTSLNASNLSSGIVPAARITASNGDFTVGANLYVNGTLSVGGTSVVLNAQQLQIKDKDIVLGFTTDSNNNDVSNDVTANHGGIAIASTVGSPILNIPLQVGVNSNPSTYKQLMWIKQGNYSGMGTDAWVSNYAISIGNTASVQNGSRLTVGAGFTVFDTYLDATDIRARQINASGIVTASSFVPSSGFIKAPDGTNALYIYSGTGNVAFQGTIGASQVNSASGYKAFDFGATTTPSVNITNSLNVGSGGTVITTTSSGLVGIGTTNPTQALDVIGNINASGTVTANSDRRLKENIRTIPNALSKVLSLRGVEYDKIDTGDHQIGVIAQEVEAIIPEVVYGEDIKSVAYANLVGLLIEAIKEQNQRIDELERRLGEQ